MERKTIGAFLAVLRKANGMTQQQVADRLNVSNKTVSKWERDESLPDITLIPALAEMFHVTSDEILRGQRLEPGERTEREQEKQAEKTHSQARAIIARTLSKHLNWTIGAASMLAAGLIVLFTVSYAFYRPALGFGIFMVLGLAALVMEFLSTNTARTALTGGDMVNEEDALTAEREILKRTKGLVSSSAVLLLIWPLPLVRSDIYTYSVISLPGYLGLIPVLAAASALIWLAAEWTCVRIWPELREEYARTEKKIRRLYAAAGCTLALILMAALGALGSVSRTMTVEAAQTIYVQFDDQAAYREYVEMVGDCAAGGEAWMEYCQENLTERGIPWKGEITDVEKDYLMEYSLLFEPNEEVDTGVYFWAFCPDMQNAAGMEACFELVHYRSGDSEAQVGILLLGLIAAAIWAAVVLLRRKYILQEGGKRRLDEKELTDTVCEEPEEEHTMENE